MYISASCGSNLVLRTRIAARGYLIDFEWGVIVGAGLAGVLLTKAAEIRSANVSGGTVSKAMSAKEKRRKDVIIEERQWAEAQTRQA